MRFVLVFLVLFSGSAFADIIDPLESACSAATEGDECTAEGDITGTCELGECCRNDYSGEGGAPETVCEACLRCVPSEGPSGGSAGEAPEGGTAGEAPEGGSAGEAPEAGSAGEAPEAGSAGEAPEAGSPGDVSEGGSPGEAPTSSDDDSGCISSANTPRNLGLLSIFVGLMLAVRLRRTQD